MKLFAVIAINQLPPPPPDEKISWLPNLSLSKGVADAASFNHSKKWRVPWYSWSMRRIKYNVSTRWYQFTKESRKPCRKWEKNWTQGSFYFQISALSRYVGFGFVTKELATLLSLTESWQASLQIITVTLTWACSITTGCQPPPPPLSLHIGTAGKNH